MDEAVITEGPHRFAVKCKPCGTRVGGISELEVGMWKLGHDTAASRHNVVELDAARARVAELEAALRGHFRDVLDDIADSHIADPERRHELIGDVVEALDEILTDPRPYARLDEQVARNLQQPGAFARPID